MPTVAAWHVDYGSDPAVAHSLQRCLHERHAFRHDQFCRPHPDRPVEHSQIGVAHLFEQQVIDLRQTILGQHVSSRDSIITENAIAWFKDELGIAIKQFKSWSKIDEMRLVANTVKHAEGGSANQLRNRRPELFKLPFSRRAGTDFGPLRVRAPLFGDGIWINRDDFTEYHAVSLAFWNELATQFGKLKNSE